ncbi:uncharacterized protein G2W53_007024 [Senna tora]|uniref:Uncharacterized protein n=1 Tax=Senna tora TaxID=362788 RepID=A0A834X666_9FABA|nr:uncharacterized protein G2W53_007024 [Senna tora]
MGKAKAENPQILPIITEHCRSGFSKNISPQSLYMQHSRKTHKVKRGKSQKA